MEYKWIVGCIIVSTFIIVYVQCLAGRSIHDFIEEARHSQLEDLMRELHKIHASLAAQQSDSTSVGINDFRVDDDTDEFILDGNRISKSKFYLGLYTFMQNQRLHIKQRQEQRNT
ncbi:MAG: hypothetical protein OXP71_07195 [Candidatus Poribacteria bacterium]|nr:hypothetical protein [Candidatus Poribacteria bacterium]